MSFSSILNQANKGSKNMSSNGLGKTYCVRKCKKLGIKNLIIVVVNRWQTIPSIGRLHFAIEFSSSLSNNHNSKSVHNL